MKTTFLLVSILCMTVAGCIGDPTIDTDEAEVLVDEPDAGEPVEGIITPGCDGPESDPHRVCEGDGGGGSGTGGGGGGGSGGGSGGGGSQTPRCLVPGWVWYPVWQRCAPAPGSYCGRSAGGDCHINIVGECSCPSAEPYPPPPPFAAEEPASLVAPPVSNIITPGCDGPETDPYRVCEGDGGGGSGTGGGGGSGGGSSGGGTCTPGAPGCSGPVNCAAGYHWDSLRRRCVFDRAGQSCHSRPPFEGQVCLYDFQGTCTCGYPEQFPPGFPYEI
jgi:hypothetical protein